MVGNSQSLLKDPVVPILKLAVIKVSKVLIKQALFLPKTTVDTMLGSLREANLEGDWVLSVFLPTMEKVGRVKEQRLEVQEVEACYSHDKQEDKLAMLVNSVGEQDDSISMDVIEGDSNSVKNNKVKSNENLNGESDKWTTESKKRRLCVDDQINLVLTKVNKDVEELKRIMSEKELVSVDEMEVNGHRDDIRKAVQTFSAILAGLKQ